MLPFCVIQGQHLERLKSTRFLETDRSSMLMVRVKVTSKSEVVGDREGKLALDCVISCCENRLLSKDVIGGHTV